MRRLVLRESVPPLLFALIIVTCGCGLMACRYIASRSPKLSPENGTLAVQEVALGPMPADPRNSHLTVSPDERRVAFTVKRGDKVAVLVDGVQGPLYDQIFWGPHFIGSQHGVAYVARRGGSHFAVVDGVEGPPYDEIVGGPWVRTDPRGVGYIASRGSAQFAVLDGVEGKAYERMKDARLWFSPDDRRTAYLVRRAGKRLMVVDGVEGKPYLDIEADLMVFSPDSKRVVYRAALRPGAWVVVVDGVEGPTYDRVGKIEFSPDSRRIAYAARRGQSEIVVVDGVEGLPDPALPCFWFSPDSRRTAYPRRLPDGRESMVVDGNEGKPYADIDCSNPFSPDSRRTAYVADLEGRLPVVVKQCVVLDGKEGPAYREIVWHPQFSPDGNQVVYVGRREGQDVVVLNGVENPAYREVNLQIPAFTHDSQHMAYAARKRGSFSWFVVFDGKEGPSHFGDPQRTFIYFSPDSTRMAYRNDGLLVVTDDGLGDAYSSLGTWDPVFSPDSKHLAYWATRRRDPYESGLRLFIDRSFSDRYPRPLERARLIFDSPTSLHTLVERNGLILRLEVAVPQ